jgi:hypothetical protein
MPREWMVKGNCGVAISWVAFTAPCLVPRREYSYMKKIVEIGTGTRRRGFQEHDRVNALMYAERGIPFNVGGAAKAPLYPHFMKVALSINVGT